MRILPELWRVLLFMGILLQISSCQMGDSSKIKNETYEYSGEQENREKAIEVARRMELDLRESAHKSLKIVGCENEDDCLPGLGVLTTVDTSSSSSKIGATKTEVEAHETHSSTCNAFQIDSRYIISNAHCIFKNTENDFSSPICSGKRVAFRSGRTPEDIYYCKRIVKVEKPGEKRAGADLAIIELNRPLPAKNSIELSPQGFLENSEVYRVGFSWQETKGQGGVFAFNKTLCQVKYSLYPLVEFNQPNYPLVSLECSSQAGDSGSAILNNSNQAIGIAQSIVDWNTTILGNGLVEDASLLPDVTYASNFSCLNFKNFEWSEDCRQLQKNSLNIQNRENVAEELLNSESINQEYTRYLERLVQMAESPEERDENRSSTWLEYNVIYDKKDSMTQLALLFPKCARVSLEKISELAAKSSSDLRTLTRAETGGQFYALKMKNHYVAKALKLNESRELQAVIKTSFIEGENKYMLPLFSEKENGVTFIAYLESSEIEQLEEWLALGDYDFNIKIKRDALTIPLCQEESN